MKKGFTLVEVLVTIVILVLLSTVVLVSIRAYVRQQALVGAVSSVAAILTDARAQTLSGNAGVQYGVHFESDTVVLFSGDTYSEGANGNEAVLLDARVTISTITLSGGGSDVVFEKLTGDTDNAGTVTLELVSDPLRQKTITVQNTGLISYN